MISGRCQGVAAGLGVLLLLIGTPPAGAAKVAFRNEGPAGVIVQATIVVRGVVVRGKPLLIKPGQADAWDAMPPGRALITILDARTPTRPVFQGAITCGAEDLYFAILPDPPLPRAKLEPVKPPMPPP